MRIFFNNRLSNFTLLFRELGYHPDRQRKLGILSFSRRLSGADYPKFHVYFEKNNNFLTLHLDMKAPSYGGNTAHSGEYSDENDWLKEEEQRIKERLSTIK
jgi:hypothetical protein